MLTTKSTHGYGFKVFNLQHRLAFFLFFFVFFQLKECIFLHLELINQPRCHQNMLNTRDQLQIHFHPKYATQEL